MLQRTLGEVVLRKAAPRASRRREMRFSRRYLGDVFERLENPSSDCWSTKVSQKGNREAHCGAGTTENDDVTERNAKFAPTGTSQAFLALSLAHTFDPLAHNLPQHLTQPALALF